MNENLLIWLNLVSIMSYFISDSDYLNNFRCYVGGLQFKFPRFVSPFRLFSDINDCGLCTSFYLGMIFSGTIFSPAKFFFDYDNLFLIIFTDGVISIFYGIIFRILLSSVSYINLKKTKKN